MNLDIFGCWTQKKSDAGETVISSMWVILRICVKGRTLKLCVTNICVITLAMPPHRPHKHHRDELKGTCAVKKYGSFRGFWKRYIHLCLWILYQGVNRSRLRWKTLHSSRTIDVRVQQLLSDFSNCFMHHLKCKTVYHFRFVLHVSPNRRTISKPSRQPESFKSLMWGDSRLSRWWIFITYTFNKSSRERRPRSRFFYVTIS